MAEQYPYGITRAWIDDGHICVITTQGDMRRDAVDAWADLVKKTYREWPAGTPILVLQDLSAPSQSLTPYARARADETYNAVPDNHPAYVAIVLRDGLIMRLVTMFVRERQHHGKQGTLRLFVSREDALRWLKERSLRSP